MAFDSDLDTARDAARRLRSTILLQLAPFLLPALACTSTAPSDGDGGVTTNQGGEDELDDDGEVSSDDADEDESEDEGESESEDDSEDDSEDTDDPKLDLPEPKFDIPPPQECTSDYFFDFAEVRPEFAGCEFDPVDPNISTAYEEICVPRPQGGECADICTDGMCEGMADCVYETPFGVCGEFEIDGDQCCSLFLVYDPAPIGRPFVVAGVSRLASVESSARSVIADHWLEVARGEHASIAAFARFVATLLRVGAPASLVAEALAAAADEARHARAALALAARFSGRPLALGGLAIAEALAETHDLAQALRAAIIEGCVGETLAAHEAACLAARAADPEVVEVLAAVAEDEARHAALAWRFVAWVLAERPELRGLAERSFAAALARSPQLIEDGDDDPELLALGRPRPGLRARWRELAIAELILPCVAQTISKSMNPSLRST